MRRTPAGWKAVLFVLRRLPQGALSRLFGWVSDRTLPKPLRRPAWSGFARLVGVNLTEVELPLEDYPSLNSFFVRRLRPASRLWSADDGQILSPVDGIVGSLGRIVQGSLLQAKGRSYRLAELLGDRTEADEFEGGVFLTLYLSPRHYHRIHSPVSGRIVSARHIPGRLLPVNRTAVTEIDRLFPRNERLLCRLDTMLGSVCVVAVGAFNVGRISATFDRSWSAVDGGRGGITNRPDTTTEGRSYADPIEVEVGAEIMAFHLGSTVILLMGRECDPQFSDHLREGMEVRVGETILECGPG